MANKYADNRQSRTRSGDQDRKREEAYGRAGVRAKRTPLEQLKALDQRLGHGVGASKERARLEALINA